MNFTANARSSRSLIMGVVFEGRQVSDLQDPRPVTAVVESSVKKNTGGARRLAVGDYAACPMRRRACVWQ
jgi:hypothetical protein